MRAEFRRRLRRSKWLAVLVILILGDPATTPGQDPAYLDQRVPTVVRGTLARHDGSPFPQARVELHSEAGVTIGTGATDDAGRFSIEAGPLRPGPYRIVVRDPTGAALVEEEVEILPGVAPRTIELQLRPGRRATVPVAEPPLPPTVHVHGPGDQPYTVVRVFYATDRLQTGEDDPGEFYGYRRSEGGRLAYGSCDVSIPRDHQLAVLEAPSVFSFEFREDPSRHVVLMRVSPRGQDNFLRDLRGAIQASSGKEAFVFVHGYNVSFEDAARRTAQLAYDLQFHGAPILYSWPAEERFWRYTVAEANVEWTTQHLHAFLAEVAARSNARAVHIIAHSMGNRAVIHALNLLALQTETGRLPIFKQVALTAPDVDAGVFAQLASRIRRTTERLTLYASSNDEALKSSALLHAFPRAGMGGEDIMVLPDVDTVEVSNVDTSLLHHSYFGSSTSVIADLYRLLRDGTPPGQRFGLRAVPRDDGAYWQFVPR